MSEALVLVVEDDPRSQRLATDILRSSNYRVVTADSCAAGIETALNERPTLTLLDLRLPDGDGFSVLAQFKATRSLAEMPVIAVTSSVMPGDRERALVAGFDAYLAKPYRFRELLSLVDHVLQTR